MELKPSELVGVIPIKGPLVIHRDLKKLYADYLNFSEISFREEREEVQLL